MLGQNFRSYLMTEPSTTGRNLWDLLSEVFSPYRQRVLPIAIILLIIALVFIHSQTPAGTPVEILGYRLYTKAPLFQTQSNPIQDSQTTPTTRRDEPAPSPVSINASVPKKGDPKGPFVESWR